MKELVVYKSRHVLEVWENGACVRRFAVGVGRGTGGHKEREGDLRTPEGEYRICVKNPKSSYHLSMGLDYPRPRDADSGLATGLISADEHRAILDAHALGQRPPWKTALGGEVYIHGHREKSGSTQGCVCLDDPDMTALFAMCDVGTRVTIHP